MDQKAKGTAEISPNADLHEYFCGGPLMHKELYSAAVCLATSMVAISQIQEHHLKSDELQGVYPSAAENEPLEPYKLRLLIHKWSEFCGRIDLYAEQLRAHDDAGAADLPDVKLMPLLRRLSDAFEDYATKGKFPQDLCPPFEADDPSRWSTRKIRIVGLTVSVVEAARSHLNQSDRKACATAKDVMQKALGPNDPDRPKTVSVVRKWHYEATGQFDDLRQDMSAESQGKCLEAFLLHGNQLQELVRSLEISSKLSKHAELSPSRAVSVLSEAVLSALDHPFTC